MLGSHHAHGNNILECGIDTHVQFYGLILGQHQEKAGSRIRRSRHIHADKFALKVINHISTRYTGQKTNGPAITTALRKALPEEENKVSDTCLTLE